MSSVILYIAASLDGFIARKNGDVSWLDAYEAGEEDYGYADFYKGVGASVMGSKTYEKSLTFSDGIDKKMPTYVVTGRNLKAPAGANTVFYSGSLVELVSNIRKETEKNIWLVGGGLLAQSFLREDLVDRIILSTTPIILGDGISLFGNLKKEIDIELIEVKSYESGIVQADYKIAV
jgi:dihydrofolate reductase